MTRRGWIAIPVLLWAAAAHGQMPVPAQAPPDGATLFRNQCAACHSLKAGEKRQGPSLAGIYGKKAGTVEGYTYSSGFKNADFVWDDAHLDAWLTNPQAVIPGAVMPYRQANAKTRAAIIDYLKEQH